MLIVFDKDVKICTIWLIKCILKNVVIKKRIK